MVVSLGTGSAPAGDVVVGRRSAGVVVGFRELAAARDFVSGIIDLLPDTDATHDLVRRQLRDTWPSLIQERTRLDAVIDARHLGLAEGDAGWDLRAMALDSSASGAWSGATWAAWSGGGTQRC